MLSQRLFLCKYLAMPQVSSGITGIPWTVSEFNKAELLPSLICSSTGSRLAASSILETLRVCLLERLDSYRPGLCCSDLSLAGHTSVGCHSHARGVLLTCSEEAHAGIANLLAIAGCKLHLMNLSEPRAPFR